MNIYIYVYLLLYLYEWSLHGCTCDGGWQTNFWDNGWKKNHGLHLCRSLSFFTTQTYITYQASHRNRQFKVQSKMQLCTRLTVSVYCFCLRSLQGKLARHSAARARCQIRASCWCWKVVKGGTGTSHVQIIFCWKGLAQQSLQSVGSIASKSEKYTGEG